MDDRLVLSLPAGTEALAPRKRFEVAEREAKLNSISVLPIFITAWVALLKQMFGDDEAIGSGGGHLQAASSISSPDQLAPQDGEVAGRGVTKADDAELKAVLDIATSFRAMTGDSSILRFTADGATRAFGSMPPALMNGFPKPVTTTSHSEAGTPSIVAPAGGPAPYDGPSAPSGLSGSLRGGGTPSSGLNTSPDAPIPVEVANDNEPLGEPTYSGGGSGGAPEDTSLVDWPQLPPWSGTPSVGESGEEPGGPGTFPLPPKDDRPKQVENRAPLVVGSVQLGSGLLNESVIVSLAQLLTGSSDPDGDRLLIQALQVSNGTLEQIAPDRWLFIPDIDASGDVVFSYAVSDGNLSVMQTADFQVLPRSRGEIAGTNGDDLLIGTPNTDLIEAAGGHDTVYGREGDDVVDGGDGDDRLFGEDGDDVIFGGQGNDMIWGGAGNDDLFGSDGDDQLHGNEGDDILIGGSGNDLLNGDEGADRLDGSDGSDILFGGPGDDVLSGGGGDDQLDGGDGEDLLFGGFGADLLRGGQGEDQLFGEEGDDELDGGAGNDILDGGSGADLLAGGNGNDQLFGGSGDDVLSGQEGEDVLDGGAGEDVLFGGAGADALDGGSGDDDLFGEEGDDHLAGGEGSDYLAGAEGQDELDGGAGADVVEGGSGADILVGGADDDVLDGGADDDTLSGGDGNDTLEGSDGKDVLFGNAGTDELDGGADDDDLFGGEGDDTLDGGAGDDVVDAGDGDDVIVFRDSDGDDIYVGGAGADTLELSDIVFDATIDLPDGWVESVGTGRDLVFEVENVRGGRGRDTLVADEAVNIMAGGAGEDTFVFRNLEDLRNDGQARDHIMDFEVGDRIDLSRLNRVLDDYATAKLFFAGYFATGFAEVGQVAFRHNTLDETRVYTIVSGHLDDGEDGDFELVLEGQHDLTERDFVLAERQDSHSG